MSLLFKRFWWELDFCNKIRSINQKVFFLSKEIRHWPGATLLSHRVIGKPLRFALCIRPLWTSCPWAPFQRCSLKPPTSNFSLQQGTGSLTSPRLQRLDHTSFPRLLLTLAAITKSGVIFWMEMPRGKRSYSYQGSPIDEENNIQHANDGTGVNMRWCYQGFALSRRMKIQDIS